LITAAALSRHFAQVTVLERDELPRSRTGAGSPQSPHVHVLLKRGADIMQKYLPGALDDIERAGGHRIDMSLDTDWYTPAAGARLPSGITMHSQTKALEFTLRRHLSREPRVCANSPRSARSCAKVSESAASIWWAADVSSPT
jgi:hypothetical protein